MTPRENAAAALELRIPEQVPTFELEFQLTQELLGREHLPWDEAEARGVAAVVEHNADGWSTRSSASAARRPR